MNNALVFQNLLVQTLGTLSYRQREILKLRQGLANGVWYFKYEICFFLEFAPDDYDQLFDHAVKILANTFYPIVKQQINNHSKFLVYRAHAILFLGGMVFAKRSPC